MSPVIPKESAQEFTTFVKLLLLIGILTTICKEVVIEWICKK